MLRYEWNNHASPPPNNLILSDLDFHHLHHNHNHNHNHNLNEYAFPSHNNHHRPIFDDSYSLPCNFPHDNTTSQQVPFYSDPRGPFPTAGSSSLLTLESLSSVMQIPKTEPDLFTNRPIGLNLGRRTYFSADDDLDSRLYRRSRAVEPALHSPKCQAEGCNADLSHSKHYHRRHKVCEFHSKASTVIAAGLTQRFCQQCSRFHLLSEFDNGKRSCRKRLADHNRRRRKSNNQRVTPPTAASMSSGENAQTSPSQNILSSPKDSGMNSSSSVTIAVSPPRVSFDSSFMQRSYE